jgi:transcriptional regulator with XRE-family HTH domain
MSDEQADLMTSKVIGNIRTLRLIKNYKQDYLAVLLRCSQNSYSKIENGHTELTIHTLFRIAHILEVDPGELLK